MVVQSLGQLFKSLRRRARKKSNLSASSGIEFWTATGKIHFIQRYDFRCPHTSENQALPKTKFTRFGLETNLRTSYKATWVKQDGVAKIPPRPQI
jgi:hypothetical protein